MIGRLKFLEAKASFSRRFSLAPDEVTQLISSNGYRGERHTVQTSDNFLLTLHRLLPQASVDRRGCVFLMHGLFRNSADFLATGPTVALPYLLADRGYDVFLGNARGTKFSLEHAHLDAKSRDFWRFSWEEIGLRDLPALLDFSLRRSGAERLAYVGHSQGCTAALVLLSELPQFNEKLSQLHLLAPAVFLHHARSPAYRVGLRLQKLLPRVHKVDIGAVLRLAARLQAASAHHPQLTLAMYKRATCWFVGRNKGEVQLSLEAIKLFSHFMSPAVSANQLRHFLQLYESQKFRKFDFQGENVAKYGRGEPPEFQLSNVTVATHIYHGEEDALVDARSVEQLARVLPNVKRTSVINDYNHLDLMLGRNCRRDLYETIVEILDG